MQTTMILLLWFSLSVSGISGQGKTLDDGMDVGNLLLAFKDANSLDQPIVTELQMVRFSLDATLNDLVAAFAPFAAMFLLLAADCQRPWLCPAWAQPGFFSAAATWVPFGRQPAARAVASVAFSHLGGCLLRRAATSS